MQYSTKIMSILFIGTITVSCGDNQDPAFSEIEKGSINLEITSDLQSSSDAVVATAERSTLSDESFNEKNILDPLFDDIEMNNKEPNSSELQNTGTIDSTLPDNTKSEISKLNDKESGSEEGVSNTKPRITENLPGNETSICAAHFRVGTENIVEVEKNNDKAPIAIESGSIIAIKVTGNQTMMNITIKGTTASDLKGVCLFLTGNSTTVDFTTLANLSGLVYYGRGNETEGRIFIGEGATIGQSVVDLRGNNNKLVMEGMGENCSNVISKESNTGGFSCK